MNFKPSKELISPACRLLLSNTLLFLLRRSPPASVSACVRRSLLGWLPSLNIRACRPLPLLRRRPQKRWLGSREALILQLRPSRLHRWVAIRARCRPPLLFYCSGPAKLFVTHVLSVLVLCTRIFSTQASVNMHKHKAKMRGGSAGAWGGGVPKS